MQLSTKQIETLAEVLRLFERGIERKTAVHYISGGFAQAEVYDEDDDCLNIELKWGIQSDCQNTVHTEQYQLPVEVLDRKISVAEMVAQIKST